MESSAHISLDILVDIAEGRLKPGALETAMAHVATCVGCNATLRRVQQVVLLMKTDTTQDAPRDLLMAAINIFPAQEKSTVRRLIATLTFDSRTAGPAFGMRSMDTPWRQMIYSVQDGDIDLRVTVDNEECIITGQVIRDGCSGCVVEISGASGSTQATLNELCEFTLPRLPLGTYSFRVKMPDVEIEIPELELKN